MARITALVEVADTDSGRPSSASSTVNNSEVGSSTPDTPTDSKPFLSHVFIHKLSL